MPQSSYAPLNPTGRLPPKITANLVGAIYKGSVKRALKDLGVKNKSISRKKLLRQAFNDPENRTKLGFANYIYGYSRTVSWGEHIYERLIKPAEFKDGEKTKIDPEKFGEQVKKEQQSPVLLVSHSSEWEALALIIMGYSIIQPEDREALCGHICKLGEGFSEYFGVGVDDDQETVADSVNLTVLASRPPAKSRLSSSSRPSSDEGWAGDAIPFDGSNDSVDALAKIQQRLQKLREHRRALGSAKTLDKPAFDECAALEQEQIKILGEFEKKLRDNYQQTVKLAQQIICKYTPDVKIAEDTPNELQAYAEWMDAHSHVLDTLLQKSNFLDQALDEFKTVSGRGPEDLIEERRKHMSVDAVAAAIDTYNLRLESNIFEIRQSSESYSHLVEKISDAIKPTLSQALFNLTEKEVLGLLGHSLYNDSLKELTPFLLRHLGELDYWTQTDSDEGVRLLRRILEERAIAGDITDLVEILCCLKPQMLQELLTRKDDIISRALILSALHMSFSEGNQVFFNQVWPSHSWTSGDREAALGHTAYDLLNYLMQLFNRVGGRAEALRRVLASSWGSDIDVDAETHDRSISAEQLAARLVYQPKLENRFYGLRREASTMYFDGLAEAITDENLPLVLIKVRDIKKQLQNGELVNTVVSNAGGRRRFDETHIAHLRRYVQTRIDEIHDWYSDSKALDAQNEEAREQDERLATLLEQLGQRSAKEGSSSCSRNWFEQQLYQLLRQVAIGTGLEQIWSNFGELSGIESFLSGKASDYQATRPEKLFSNEWPVWLEFGPQSMSLWAGYVDGNVSWRQMYQDSVATLLLERELSPGEIVKAFLDCQLVDAAAAACNYSEFKDDPEVRELRSTVDLIVGNKTGFEELLADFDKLESEYTSDHAKKLMGQVEDPILELSDRMAEMEPSAANTVVRDLTQSVEKISNTLAESDDESRSAKARLIVWLSEANIDGLENETIAYLTRRIDQVKEDNKDRREHILDINKLRDQQLPRTTQTELANYVAEADRPSRWPEKELSGEASLYIDQVRDERQRWWEAARAIVSSSEIQDELWGLDSCIEKHLIPGVKDIISGSKGRGHKFLLAFDSVSKPSLSEFYAALREEGFLEGMVSDQEEVVTITKDHLEDDRALEAAAVRLETILGDVPISKGAEQIKLTDALTAISEQDYGRAEKLVTTADMPARSRHLAIAIRTWANQYNSDNPDRDTLDLAFGLFFRYWGVLQKREFGGVHNLILREWFRLGHFEKESAPRMIDEYLACCRDNEFEARRVAKIVQICGGRVFYQNVWDLGAGQQDITVSSRTKLLLLLYDLGEEEAILNSFEQFTSRTQQLLRHYLVLIRRASTGKDAKLFQAINKTLERIEKLTEPNIRPIRSFAAAIKKDIDISETSVSLTVLDAERISSSNEYSVLLRLEPEPSDPPVELKIWIGGDSDSTDFRAKEESEAVWVVCEDSILYEAREHAFSVEATDEQAAHSILFNFLGKTVAGNEISGSKALEVDVSSASDFASLDMDNLLEIYEGYDGKPVRGRAFIGRQDEIEQIRTAVALENSSAMLLYGVRRIGKTSLLQACASQMCVSSNSNSNSLVLTVPVDSFNPTERSGEFLNRFLRHITSCALGPLNEPLKNYLLGRGFSRKDIQKAAQFTKTDADSSFADRLDIYMKKLCELAGPNVNRAIIIFDEFDKMLKAYREELGENVESLLNQLRLMATEYNDIGLVIAGSDSMRKITAQYGNALYGSTAVIELSCFDSSETFEDAKKIIQPTKLHGRRDFSLVFETMVKMTGGHPLYLRLLAFATAKLARRNRISPGLVYQAVRKLLNNEVLQGTIPEFKNTVKATLQAVSPLGDELDENRALLLLYEIAAKTTLEGAYVEWARVEKASNIVRLGSPSEWRKYRDDLREANLLKSGGKYQWGLRFPILAETLRLDQESQIERYATKVGELINERIND